MDVAEELATITITVESSGEDTCQSSNVQPTTRIGFNIFQNGWVNGCNDSAYDVATAHVPRTIRCPPGPHEHEQHHYSPPSNVGSNPQEFEQLCEQFDAMSVDLNRNADGNLRTESFNGLESGEDTNDDADVIEDIFQDHLQAQNLSYMESGEDKNDNAAVIEDIFPDHLQAQNLSYMGSGEDINDNAAVIEDIFQDNLHAQSLNYMESGEDTNDDADVIENIFQDHLQAQSFNYLESVVDAEGDPDLIQDTISSQPDEEQNTQENSAGSNTPPPNQEQNQRSNAIDSDWWEFQYTMTDEGILLKQKQYELEVCDERITRLQKKRHRLLSRLMGYAEAGCLLKNDLALIKGTGAGESLLEATENLHHMTAAREKDVELMTKKYVQSSHQYMKIYSKSSATRTPEESKQVQRSCATQMLKNAIAKLQNNIQLAEGQLFAKEYRMNVINTCETEVNYEILHVVASTIEEKVLPFVQHSVARIDEKIILIRQETNNVQSTIRLLERHLERQMHYRQTATEF